MKLWILRPVEGLPPQDDPWKPWYDKTFGFVVRAANEQEARGFAHASGSYENSADKSPWLDQRYSTCVPLTAAGAPGVVMDDHAAY